MQDRKPIALMSQDEIIGEVLQILRSLIDKMEPKNGRENASGNVGAIEEPGAAPRGRIESTERYYSSTESRMGEVGDEGSPIGPTQKLYNRLQGEIERNKTSVRKGNNGQ